VVSQNEKVVEIELAELKPWHIHEVKIENLKSQTGEELSNNYIAYTLNRLLEETPPDPLHIKKQEKN
jgi:hypothetical protein